MNGYNKTWVNPPRVVERKNFACKFLHVWITVHNLLHLFLVPHVLVSTGTCTTLSKEECASLARSRGFKLHEYHWKDSVPGCIYGSLTHYNYVFNSATTNVHCSKVYPCVCKPGSVGVRRKYKITTFPLTQYQQMFSVARCTHAFANQDLLVLDVSIRLQLSL